MTARTDRSDDQANPEAQREVAAYVAALSADLSVMSRRNGLTTLAYLLDMARLEADSAARADARGRVGRPSGPSLDLP